MEKLIILDRDGVINRDSDAYIKSVEEWQPEEGAIDAITKLTQHKFKIAVATNQSGIFREYYQHSTLNSMHNKLRQLCAQQGGKIGMIVYCPHGPNDECACRKPKAGLFTKIEDYFSQSLTGVYAVGDSYRDLLAALEVNAKPILVLTGKGEKTFAENRQQIMRYNIPVKRNLLDAVNYVCENSSD